MALNKVIKQNGIWGNCLLVVITIFLFFVSLFCGPVDIPSHDILFALFGGDNDSVASIILFESRLPMALTAIIAGCSLSVSGLILQTVFQNPLAGPSLLGVSSGASLGVALVMMAGGATAMIANGLSGTWIVTMLGAIVGAMIVIALLLSFSAVIRNAVMLLILGVMISYLTGSIISLLSYIASSDSLKSYTVWGLGSFSGVTMNQIPVFAVICSLLCIGSIGCIKPLNAMLLGERYAGSIGYHVKRMRGMLLLLSGIMTAIVTAYCGPIAFIGLIVPHIARMLFRTSNHEIILPASIFTGASIALICVILSAGTLSSNVLPINVVTPLIGVPIILYIIVRRNNLPYFK